jgi:hypothetical protein
MNQSAAAIAVSTAIGCTPASVVSALSARSPPVRPSERDHARSRDLPRVSSRHHRAQYDAQCVWLHDLTYGLQITAPRQPICPNRCRR